MPVSRINRWLPATAVALVGWTLALLLPLTAGAWWLVAAYPQLIDERAVRFTTDRISYLPISGGEWVLQPWSISALLGWAWQNGGIVGLSLIAGLLGASLLLAVYALARASRLSLAFAPAAAAWVTLAVLPLLWPLTLQSQTFAVVLAALLMVALARGNWWWAPIIVIVWANVHGSTPIALGMVWGAALGLLAPAGEHVPPSLVRMWPRLGWALLTSAMVFVSPLHVDVLSYMRSVRNVPNMEELTPVWSSLEPFSVGGIWVLAGLVIAMYASRGDALRSRELLPLGALAVLAFASQRNTVWFAIVLVPALARACEYWWTTRSDTSVMRHYLPRVAGPALGAIAIVALIGAVAYAPPTDRRAEAADRGMPVQLLDEALPGGDAPIVSDVAWADWLHVRSGGRKVAFDARFERYRHSDIERYLAWESGARDERFCAYLLDEPSVAVVHGRDIELAANPANYFRGTTQRFDDPDALVGIVYCGPPADEKIA